MNIVRKSLLAGSMAMAVSVVGYFEGRQLVGYVDPVGIPTVCYGHTATAVVGQARSAAECEALLQQDLGIALVAVDRHLPDLPPATRAALGSFVYNVGAGAFQSSTLLRKAKAGDLVGACNELSRWVYAGGRVLPGLVRRREAERELCLEGLRNDSIPAQLDSDPDADRGPALVAGRPSGGDDYHGFQPAQLGSSSGGQPAQHIEAAA